MSQGGVQLVHIERFVNVCVRAQAEALRNLPVHRFGREQHDRYTRGLRVGSERVDNTARTAALPMKRSPQGSGPRSISNE